MTAAARPVEAPPPRPAPASVPPLALDLDWGDLTGDPPVSREPPIEPPPIELSELGAEEELEPLPVELAPRPPTGGVAIPPSRAPDGGEAQLRQALAQASREVIERIAWEIIPPLAETIIREHVERLAKERQR